MKRVISFALLLVLVLCLCIFASTASVGEPEATESKVKLSELSENECMELLSKMDVRIPADLIRSGIDVPGLVKLVFIFLDKDPDELLMVSYRPDRALYEDIRAAVIQYYGLPDTLPHAPPGIDREITKPTYAKDNVKLSTLSEDECLVFLYKMDVGIPAGLVKPGYYVPGLVRDFILLLDEDPNASFSVHDEHVMALFWDVRDAVLQYYGLPDTAAN